MCLFEIQHPGEAKSKKWANNIEYKNFDITSLYGPHIMFYIASLISSLLHIRACVPW